MNTHAVNPNLEFIDHLAIARTALGREWLKWCVHWRRFLLRCLIKSGDVVKRALDITGSAAFLIVFGPLYLLLAGLVKLEDGGSVFFNQTRVGRFGREFQMYKFRSMRPNAEAELQKLLAQNEHAEGITFKMKNDPRITCVGKWLRRFSLDELPQFLNVLKGDMSLVGPRPPTPREVSFYSLADRRRLSVKPGTFQHSGIRSLEFT